MKRPTTERIIKMYEHACSKKDQEYMDVCTWAYNYFDNEIKRIEKWREFCKPENFLQACKKEEKQQPIGKKKRVIVIKKQEPPVMSLYNKKH